MFEDGREIMIGEARYVVDERDPTTCEFAIAVADAWQRCGIARALLVRLERQAAESGFRSMVADTLVTNRAMLGLARRTRYARHRQSGGQDTWRGWRSDCRRRRRSPLEHAAQEVRAAATASKT